MFAVYVPVHKKKLMFANMICDQPPATPKVSNGIKLPESSVIGGVEQHSSISFTFI
jgi:hypothetical protein